jgi:protocatechuate 3,4-dioxygenase beta subunit
MPRPISLLACVLACAAVLGAQSQPPPAAGSQRPARDTPAQQQDAPPPPAGRIMGRVVAADNGRPVKRARIFISAAELPEGRGALTDESGVFDLTELPAGRYTLSVSKAGFVSLSYGQRRPLQAGTPLQLADGQQLKGVDFRLPRGSVIAGHVFDEDGDAMPGASVRVLRYRYLQGDRRLTPAGSAQTDDRGQYRIWGLMPGDYYVSAVARNFNGGRFGRFGGRGGFRDAANPEDDDEAMAYAPTYFPGVPSVNEARPVTVGLGQESLDIDFNLQLVRTARVTGHVTNPDGTPTTSGSITLTPDAGGAGGRQLGMNYGSRIEWDGAFTVTGVPPGRYQLRARGNDTEEPQYGSQPLTVGSADVGNLTVVLSPGGTISGTIAFSPSQSSPPDPTQIRIAAPSLESGVGGSDTARVEKDGRFSIHGLAAGPHLIRPNGNLHGWSLKSVIVDGRDMTDTPIEVRSGQAIPNIAIVFTDTETEIDGTVTDEHGGPVTEYTVLAFSTDASHWRALSRHIMTTRPDQTGRFKIRGLPPGEYYVVPVDPSEQGEWFEPAYLDEHRTGASRLTLGDGETKTQDFKVRP